MNRLTINLVLVVVAAATLLLVAVRSVDTVPGPAPARPGPAIRTIARGATATIARVGACYWREKGRPPTSLLDLTDSTLSMQLAASDFRDPWGNSYVVATADSGFSVTSYGADGEPGGEGADGDIVAVVRVPAEDSDPMPDTDEQ